MQSTSLIPNTMTLYVVLIQIFPPPSVTESPLFTPYFFAFYCSFKKEFFRKIIFQNSLQKHFPKKFSTQYIHFFDYQKLFFGKIAKIF